MENKYYTPEISDLHVGYECEMKNSSDPILFEWEWVKFKNNFDFDMGKPGNDHDYNFAYLSSDLKEGNIRTPYLTKEQIEVEGWKEDSIYPSGEIIFIKGTKNNFYEFIFKPGNIYLTITKVWDISHDDSPSYVRDIKFKGDIPSINELRTIQKLLNIK